MDLRVYHLLNDYAAGHDWFEDPLRFFATAGVVVFALLLGALWLRIGPWRVADGRRAVAAAGFSAALGLAANQAISHVYVRARPFVHHHHHLFVARSHDPSFPSDHATGAFALAAAIFLRNRRAGAVALALAVLVATGRVVVGTHWPSDVLGGAAIGIAAALVVFWAPVRRRVDRLADLVSRAFDRLAPGQPAIGPSSGSRP